MTSIRAYHRPDTIEDALDLLTRPGSVPLGGGTVLNGLPTQAPTEVIDLQALDLAHISLKGAVTSIGATATLQMVVASDDVPPLLRDLAHREAPNTIRNAATIGGTVAAAEPESQLLAGLIAHGATISMIGPKGTEETELVNLLADRTMLDGRLITTIAVTVGASGFAARAGRTPGDTPIVMVAGVRDEEGVRLAATGVAATPVPLDLDNVEALHPPADFRGSATYRRHLAAVLGARVMTELSREDQR